eukprot:TRINITY_DN145_c0_g1_i15.p1 TRINITY_DN145_c0_g1~~TRINITY_DN145_c0_g1_i15.p1  ORF type:complete len:863 (+),score=101.55 TRINITY_DN145_c0_g1_i15:42-2591(+)
MATIYPTHSPAVTGAYPRDHTPAINYDRALIFHNKNTDEYFGFTPYAQIAFNLEGTYWLTLEHYIQAMKFVGHSSRIDAIKRMKIPQEIRGYVSDPENARLSDTNWNNKKCEYMYHALFGKFSQNQNILNQLLRTENRFLIYEDHNDSTWSIGNDGKGPNYLGRLLCNLRTYLRHNPKTRTPPTYRYSDLPENKLSHTFSASHEEVTPMLPSSDGALYFGDKTKRFFELCNDSNYGIELDGILWMTVTHYYLAQKFHGNVHLQNTIAAFESPSQARQFAYSKNAFQAPDFQLKRDSIMQQALDAKFAKYPAIAETLASTHPRKLIYECAEDSYWGIGHDAKGLNRLGIMLTDIRKKLHQTSLPSPHHDDDLYFTSSDSEYYEFTPYSQHSIIIDGELWPTAFHYLQAQKFIYRPDIVKLIQASESPLAAWDIAHSNDNAKLVPMSFIDARDNVMKEAMWAKVEQHEDVCRLLKGTGRRRLVFSDEDTHWGIRHDRTGENMIGKILMDIRSTLASIPRKTPEIYKPFPKPHPPVLPPVLPREVSTSTPTSTDVIRFFDQKDDLYPLTTFSMFRFKIADCVYRSLNHYFQAQKFTTSPEIYQSIINAPTPVEAIKISQGNSKSTIPDFNANRLNIMEIGLKARFEQNSSLKELLMETRNKDLILNNKNDTYWGIGDGSGKNRFGKLLMKIREQYNTRASGHLTSTPSRTPTYNIDTEPIDYPRDRPMPMPRMTRAPKHVFLDTECVEPPASFVPDRENSVILAKNASGETIATHHDPTIKYPSSLCHDEEHLYVITAPTLVKIDKATGKKVQQLPLKIPLGEVIRTMDGIHVVYYQRSASETMYSTDLVQL